MRNITKIVIHRADYWNLKRPVISRSYLFNWFFQETGDDFINRVILNFEKLLANFYYDIKIVDYDKNINIKSIIRIKTSSRDSLITTIMASKELILGRDS